MNDYTDVIVIVQLGLLCHRRSFMRTYPTFGMVERWVAQQCLLQTAAFDDATQLHGGNTALYELPLGLPVIQQSRNSQANQVMHWMPSKVLKFMKCSTHLKNNGKGILALKDAFTVACGSDEM